ncbi:hypothetical protein [Nocardioides sambongensis]|uniref:hypothetical protein n=1 Tax=Nocardioides sambongensis TaxID=2589074 RepID=UPI00112BF768|nr:hypothetical protein [Nocardioides sambongensis]
MANDSGGSGSPTWRRYRRPGDPRDEEGQTSGAKPSPKAAGGSASTKSPSTKSPSTKSGAAAKPRSDARSGSSGRRRGAYLGGGAVLLTLAVIGIAAAVDGDGDGGSDEPEIDTTFLQADTLTSVIEEAEEAHTDIQGSPISVRIGESSVDVEYYDRTSDELWTYSSTDYLDGYTIRVRRDADAARFGRPRPIDLDAIDTAALETVAERLVEDADDPDYYTVTIEADDETGEITYDMTVSSGDDYLRVTTDVDGDVISEDE